MAVIQDREASALYIGIARQHALSHPISTHALDALTPELDGNDLAEQTLPLTGILDFWQQTADLCAAPTFGLQAGNQCHLSVYGLFSHLLMSCPTLHRALQLGADYLHLLNEALETRLDIGPDESTYSLTYPVDHPGARHHIEFHLASVVQLGRQIVRQKERARLRPRRIEFCHGPAAAKEQYEKVFDCEVAFGKPRNQMVFSTELLEIPGHTPNSGLYGHMLKLLEAIRDHRRSQKPFRSRVCETLNHQQSTSTWPTLEALAHELGVSPSSLKRKLKQEQTSYQEICDDLRYKQARRMLTAKRLAIGEIAHQLGFSSPASFSRSFKRWSGMAPHDYAIQAKPGAPHMQESPL
ncbi:AraC family transcriptional regulator [Marinobacter zhejiangensis]|uniref:AraC-type DNA-binding protein n=1 Tax=Marinobacter zhejiangensis TaxID=488535 RepID=A0A1I4Q4C3_9GAMM|nr:AraC family transcriptional regulator [Marinobacter zhejiangensis]SFM34912.1 AraC-type DNA-binding protein [Marinobacter zhejiangensis]